jgi:hypothetical protein
VFAGHAHDRDAACRGGWTDSDGYEASAYLVPREDVETRLAGDAMSQLAVPFLALL